MVEKPVAAVAVINTHMKTIKGFCSIIILILSLNVTAQEKSTEYKKRVLESTEVNLLSSYYSQDGENAAVTGGRGTEELTDFAPSINVSIPLNDDDVLTVDATVSAYTSASSSNIDPFDGDQPADPFVASSGASRQDTWFGLTANYAHSSDDRNTMISGNLSFANEYDYSSIGFGGSLTKLYNQKNTELQVNVNAFIDKWRPQYPIEFREGFNISDYDFTGEGNYSPGFTRFQDESRSSYSLGLSLSQILSKSIQTVFMGDIIFQNGLLSTPHQRVYFSDFENTIIEDFELGNDIERLPESRTKIALGNRTNFYLNQSFILRTYYRYYTDDWDISSHTFKIELPVKLGMNFTFYPMYRYYTQTAAKDFGEYNSILSTQEFYTSDYDLAEYDAHQYGIGFKYYDPLSKFKIGNFGLKSINLEYNHYNRSMQNFSANITSLSFNFSGD